MNSSEEWETVAIAVPRSLVPRIYKIVGELIGQHAVTGNAARTKTDSAQHQQAPVVSRPRTRHSWTEAEDLELMGLEERSRSAADWAKIGAQFGASGPAAQTRYCNLKSGKAPVYSRPAAREDSPK